MINVNQHLSEAISHYWLTLRNQSKKQAMIGANDQGARCAVTGGAQMDGFVSLITKLAVEAGMKEENVFCNKCLELPGYFRPTKKWDLLIIKNNQLVAAIEAKSQAGPSFGNNFNNRTEEAMGSALDLWTAFREGAFNGKTLQPWLGYIFHLEDCPASQASVLVSEPHFKVFPEFKNASYAKRYELFCRKLIKERHYNATTFLMSNREDGLKGKYREPANDLTFNLFAKSFVSHVLAFGD